jgi:hypothetical protein
MEGNHRVLFSSARESKVIFGPFQYNQIFFPQSPMSSRLQAEEWKLKLAFWIPLHFCSVSVLFVFLGLAVFCVSGLLTSLNCCSQAKESKTKPSCSRLECSSQKEQRTKRKSSPPCVSLAVYWALYTAPTSYPSINSWLQLASWSGRHRDTLGVTQVVWQDQHCSQACRLQDTFPHCLIHGLQSFPVSP